MPTLPRARGILTDVTQIAVVYNYQNSHKTSSKYKLNVILISTCKTASSAYNKMPWNVVRNLYFKRKGCNTADLNWTLRLSSKSS